MKIITLVFLISIPARADMFIGEGSLYKNAAKRPRTPAPIAPPHLPIPHLPPTGISDLETLIRDHHAREHEALKSAAPPSLDRASVSPIGGLETKIKAAESMGLKVLPPPGSRKPSTAIDDLNALGRIAAPESRLSAADALAADTARVIDGTAQRDDSVGQGTHVSALVGRVSAGRAFKTEPFPDGAYTEFPLESIPGLPLPFLSVALPDGRRVTTDANGVFSIQPAGQKITVKIPDGTYSAAAREQYLLLRGIPKSAIRRSMKTGPEGEEQLEFDLTPEQFKLLLDKKNIKADWIVAISAPAPTPSGSALGRIVALGNAGPIYMTVSAPSEFAIGQDVRIGQHQGKVVEINRDHVILDNGSSEKTFTLIPRATIARIAATTMSGTSAAQPQLPSAATGWRLAAAGLLSVAAGMFGLQSAVEAFGTGLWSFAAADVIRFLGGVAAFALGLHALTLGRAILYDRKSIGGFWALGGYAGDPKSSFWLRAVRLPPPAATLILLGFGAIAAGYAFFDSASAWQPALVLPGIGLFAAGEWMGNFPEAAASFWKKSAAFLRKPLGFLLLFAASVALNYPFVHSVSLDQIATLPPLDRFAYFAAALLAAAAGAKLAWPNWLKGQRPASAFQRLAGGALLAAGVLQYIAAMASLEMGVFLKMAPINAYLLILGSVALSLGSMRAGAALARGENPWPSLTRWLRWR